MSSQSLLTDLLDSSSLPTTLANAYLPYVLLSALSVTFIYRLSRTTLQNFSKVSLWDPESRPSSPVSRRMSQVDQLHESRLQFILAVIRTLREMLPLAVSGGLFYAVAVGSNPVIAAVGTMAWLGFGMNQRLETALGSKTKSTTDECESCCEGCCGGSGTSQRGRDLYDGFERLETWEGFGENRYN